MLERRQVMTADELAGAGDALLRLLLTIPAFRAARRVACFLSLPDELPTGGIIRHCYGEGQSVCVPAWRTESRAYDFAALEPGAHLVPGRMRVPEPEEKRWVAVDTIDTLLVPGLAFDRQGGRLGFGAGHYDRLLARCRPDSVSIALACDWQVLPRVPQAAHDVRMDWIVTDLRHLDCRRG